MITTTAPVVAVTVLEDRASITRRATLAIDAGQHRVTIERVSAVIADKTLFATATNARILDTRIERYLAPVRPNATGEPLGQLREHHAQLIARRDTAAARYHAAHTEVAAIAEILEAALRDLAIAAARGIAADGVEAQLTALDRAESAAREAVAELELEIEETRRLLDRLAARIRLAEVETHEQTARLIVDLVADATSHVTLTIGYVVPGAAWRPYHRAVLDVLSSKVELQTTACVWQATGEDWVDAAMTFSLERASLGVEPPGNDVPKQPPRGHRLLDRALVIRAFGILGPVEAVVEMAAFAMLRRSMSDVREVRRQGSDTVSGDFTVNPSTGALTPGLRVPPRFQAALERTRQLHVEDWIAAIAFNHLISAADAFVSAQLWDVPTRVAFVPSSRGLTLVATVRF